MSRPERTGHAKQLVTRNNWPLETVVSKVLHTWIIPVSILFGKKLYCTTCKQALHAP